MSLNPESEPSASTSMILSIDFRSGSVVMRRGSEVWRGENLLNPAERTQLATSSVTVELTPSSDFASLPGSEG